MEVIEYHYIEMDANRNIVKVHVFDDSLSDKKFEEVFGPNTYVAAQGMTKFGNFGYEDDGQYYTKVLYVFPI